METLIQNMIAVLQNVVQNNHYIISIMIGMLIIILESMIPMLPLALFIALNMLMFGNFLGFLISWIATIIGCSISFFLFRFFKNKILYENQWINKVNKISFSALVSLLSIPFTPAFSINIGAGLSDMKYSKYLFALIISKLFLVYFWGFIGTTFLESITDIGVLWKLGTMVVLAFLLSKCIHHYFCIQ